MCVWFAVLALLGIINIAQYPSVLEALNPHLGGAVLRAATAWLGFLVLGAVVLAVTGAEALYADMGHFGKRPIRLAWLWFVFPALLLNYFGQGALLLRAARGRPASVLPPRPGLGALSDGGAGHARHGDRFAGGDLGRVLAHPSGDPARLLSAPDDRAHLGEGDRPGLPAVDQLGPVPCSGGAGAGLRLLQQPGGRLRHRGDRHHGHRLDPDLLRHAPPVALAAVAGDPDLGRASC